MAPSRGYVEPEISPVTPHVEEEAAAADPPSSAAKFAFPVEMPAETLRKL